MASYNQPFFNFLLIDFQCSSAFLQVKAYYSIHSSSFLHATAPIMLKAIRFLNFVKPIEQQHHQFIHICGSKEAEEAVIFLGELTRFCTPEEHQKRLK